MIRSFAIRWRNVWILVAECGRATLSASGLAMSRRPVSGRGLLEQVCLRLIANVDGFNEWRSVPSALLGLVVEGLADPAGFPPIIQQSQCFDC